MRFSRPQYGLLALALAVAAGWGCSGGGCSSLSPLPKDPAPTGLPRDQQIEGGIQARITKPGMDKLSSWLPGIIQKQLGKDFCALHEYDLVNGFFYIHLCDKNYCPDGKKGCTGEFLLNSGQRPNGIDDGKDKVSIAMADGNKPELLVDVSFDFYLPIFLHTFLFDCTLELSDQHYKNKPNNDPVHLVAHVKFGIDNTTGQLTMTLGGIDVKNTQLHTGGCGLGDLADLILGALDSLGIENILFQYLVNALQPQLNDLVQKFLPKPPGMAGVVSTGALLASFNAPPEAALETYLVAGGYVSAKTGGLNLGVITGLNSDRDPKTRDIGHVSEPNLCVPARPVPALGGAPWKLTPVPGRMDFALQAANEFSGTPDPVNGQGKVQDVAIGISRTFLDLAGFHAFHSGTLCLGLSGNAVKSFNAGALSVVMPSLTNLLGGRKAPLALALRPETAPTFTLGEGTAKDPLLHVGISDMRIDLYAFVEERFVRILTLALDVNVLLNLSITMQNGKPAIQPMLSGIDKNSVKVRVTNTDLIQEDPAKIGKSLLTLIDVAVSQLLAGIKPIPLPSFGGFSLSGLSIKRVVTAEDSFLAIMGGILKDPQSNMAALGIEIPDWVEEAPTPHSIDTSAELVDVSVPPVDVIATAIDHHDLTNLPSVTLALGSSVQGEIEWQYRVDGGVWHAWSSDPHPTITDPAFVLQARHTIEVRARQRDDWASEDETPKAIDVLIDSAPPVMQPQVVKKRISFPAWDNVSDEAALSYSWQRADGTWVPTRDPALSLDDAWAASGEGRRPLQLRAVDEAGNEVLHHFDLTGLSEFHGRTTTPPSSGCGCTLGQARTERRLPLLLGILAFVLLGRRRSTLLAVLGLATVAQLGCSQAVQGPCHVDDDCRAQICLAGEIPQCMSGSCGCQPDQRIGDIGRYASMALRGPIAYLAAYNNDYGDLMIGHISPPGVVNNWEYVDGVPELTAPDNPLSQVRAGISDKGDDVGQYTSLAITPAGDPAVAYYDATHGALKFASFGAVRWHTHIIDKGAGMVGKGGDEIGRFASLTLAKDGLPGIAYYAQVAQGKSGKREGQLRFAQSKVADPQSAADWTITVVDALKIPDPGMDPPPLPEGVGLFPATGRKADGGAVIAYYDRTDGELRYVEYDSVGHKWGLPINLGEGDIDGGLMTGDVGLYPSMVVDGQVAHISYVDATHDNLLYINTKDKKIEIVDDGYRPMDEKTLDGLDAPVYHLVGDSSSIQVFQNRVMIAYQDSTTVQLRFATRDPNNKKWTTQAIAGHATPFQGSYGFYAQNRLSGGQAVLSSYVIDQHHDIPQFFVETFGVTLPIIM